MKKILKLSLILFLVSAVVAGVLGGVYIITKEPIDQYNKEKTAKAYFEVLPHYDGVDYDSIAPEDYVKYINPDNAKTVNEEVKVADAKITVLKCTLAEDGKTYVIECETSGSQGNVVTVVGVDKETLTCTAIAIKESSETSGLGAEASKPAFKDQLVGKDATNCFTTKEEGEVVAISGATITSKAVTRSVSAAIDYVANLG